MTEQRIKALQDRHTALDNQIDDEEKRPAPDATGLRSMKAEKLSLKDEISKLENS